MWFLPHENIFCKCWSVITWHLHMCHAWTIPFNAVILFNWLLMQLLIGYSINIILIQLEDFLEMIEDFSKWASEDNLSFHQWKHFRNKCKLFSASIHQLFAVIFLFAELTAHYYFYSTVKRNISCKHVSEITTLQFKTFHGMFGLLDFKVKFHILN